MSKPSRLFRSEVVAEQRHCHDSEPLRLGANPWRWSGVLVLGCAIGVLLFLWLGEYTRKARAQGEVVPAWGLVRVQALQTGVVTGLRVKEGQQVHAGDALLVLHSDMAVASGEVRREVLARLDERSKSLAQSRSLLGDIYAARQQEALQKQLQLQARLASLQREWQLTVQRSELAAVALQRQQQLLAEGFVSAAAVDDKRAELAAAQSQLAAIQVSQAEVHGLLQETLSAIRQLPLAARNEKDSLVRDQAALAAERVQQQSMREIAVLAPRDGVVTALQVRDGQTVAEQQALVAIVPSGVPYRVELFVTSRDIGFIRPGQAVTLRYQAFPYQKFGVQQGTVQEVTRAVLSTGALPVGLPDKESYYRLLVAPTRQTVSAGGQVMPLQSGMKVEADVQVERRRLWEWLLEPLLGVRQVLQATAMAGVGK